MAKATQTSTTTTAPRTSRRAIMAGIAATAVLPAAAATALANLAAPDPVHALIAAALEKHEAFLAAVDAAGDCSDGNPQASAAADALVGQRCGEASDAFDNFAACVPTTSAGISAALKFFAARTEPGLFWDTEFLKTFLVNMATALERIEVRPS